MRLQFPPQFHFLYYTVAIRNNMADV